MKKFRIYFIIATAVLMGTGCEKYLDKSPDLGLSEEDVYKNYSSIRGFLDQSYNLLEQSAAGFQDARERGHIGLISDEFATLDNDSKAILLHSGNWLQARKNDVMELGVNGGTPISKSYQAIRIANLVLANYANVPGMTQEQTNEIAGQAHFLRAWYYFQLIKRYGGMPIFSKAFEGEGVDVPRVTYHESQAWMMEDIESAITMLPDVWDDANTGRATKMAAMALKSMTQLYDASPLMQNDLLSTTNKGYDKERAKIAAKSATALIRYIASNSNVNCRLLPTADYQKIFYFTAPPFRSPEYIWYNRTPTPDQKRTTRTLWLYATLAEGTGPDGASMCAPTQNMVDLYEKKGPDGNYYPIQKTNANYNNQDPYVDRDPRFYNNILTPGTQWGLNKNTPLYITTYEGGEAANEMKSLAASKKRQQTGYLCKKFMWPEANRYTAQWDKYKYFTAYIRLAQIYLDLAEASFEATGDANAIVEGCDLSAAAALNIVRNRAGITNVTADIVSDPVQFKEAYRRERAVELMFENARWWDIRRWMIAEDLFKATYPIKGMKATPINPNHASVANKSTLKFTYEVIDVVPEIRNFRSRNYWYPFPSVEVSSLKNLVQNPGW